MTTTNNQTSHLPAHVAAAIQEARDAVAAHDRAITARTEAQQAHYDADTTYRQADLNTDDEADAWDAFNDSIDTLCAAARAETDARIHRDHTRAALERIWTDYQAEQLQQHI